eukprot:357528-Chlamydomonas_euryale.AAC.9
MEQKLTKQSFIWEAEMHLNLGEPAAPTARALYLALQACSHASAHSFGWLESETPDRRDVDDASDSNLESKQALPACRSAQLGAVPAMTRLSAQAVRAYTLAHIEP